MLTLLVVLSLGPVATAQVRFVSYNTLDSPDDATDKSELQTIFSALANTDVNGIAKRPDVVAIQETNPAAGSEFAAQLNNAYGTVSYTHSVNGSGSDRTGFVYDSSSVNLLGTQSFAMGTRPGYRARFRPKGYSSSQAAFYAYSVHLDAGDQQQRGIEATNLRTNGDALGEGTHLIYSGDFNIDYNFEPGYTNMVAAGPGQAHDPIQVNESWHNNARVAETHTQSPRVSTGYGDGGAPGGMDDRFDWQFVSDEMKDGEGLSYIGPTSTGLSGTEHSYNAFGNDGNTFNQSLTGNPNNRSQPMNVLSALQGFSDHLPVVADYQVPAKMNASMGDPSHQTVLVGAEVDVPVMVENTADVMSVHGADELEYMVEGLGAISGTRSGTDAALGGGAQHIFSFDTASAGDPVGAAARFTTESAGAQNQQTILGRSIRVLDHANGSFRASSDHDSLTIDFGQVNAGSGTISDTFEIFNLEATENLTAELLVDSPTAVSGDTSVLSLLDNSGGVVAGESLGQEALFNTTSAGEYSASWEIPVADDALPGAASDLLHLTLMGEVLPGLTGDVNADGQVTQADLDLVLQNWGESTVPTSWEANFDGQVSQGELDGVLQNWGVGTGASGAQVVPEPSAFALFVLGATALGSRRHKRHPK